MQRTQVDLTPAQAQGITRVAAATGKKQSVIIREAIDQYLSRSDPLYRLFRLRDVRGMWSAQDISLENLRSNFDRF